MNAFYAQKVAELKAATEKAKTAADNAATAAETAKKAYTEAQNAADIATGDYNRAVQNNGSDKEKAQSAVVDSIKNVISAANAAYQTDLYNANKNSKSLKEYREQNAKIADAYVQLANKTESGETIATVTGKLTLGDDGKYALPEGTTAGAYFDYNKAKDAYDDETDATKKAEKKTALDAAKEKVDGIETGIDGYVAKKTELKNGLKKSAADSSKYVFKSADLTTYSSELGNGELNIVTSGTDSEVLEITTLESYKYTAKYKVLNAAKTGTVDSESTPKVVGKTDGSTTNSWYKLLKEENAELDTAIANNKDLAALKSDMDAKVKAAADAKTAYDTANTDATTALKAYNDAAAKQTTAEKHQAAAKDDMTDAMLQDMRNGNYHGYTEVEEAKKAADAAATATEKARSAKNDAFEEYTTYSHIFTRAKKEYQAYKNLKKPVIKVKAGKRCVKVTWKKVTNATKYKVRVKKGNGSYKTYYTTKTKFTVKAKKGTKVKVCVRAQNDAGHSKYSTKKAARAK